MTKPSFAILNEMREAPGILRNFDAQQTLQWRNAIQYNKRILLTGEGSSRIFPAHNLIAQAMRNGTAWQIHTEGARQAFEYDLNDFVVIGASNSGQTKELIALFADLAESDIPRFALTATPDSKITELADTIILSCGKEKATAATKSVFEQALIYQSLLLGDEWQYQTRAADICDDILAMEIAPEIITALSPATCLYFAGRNDGVAEELTLKSYEITRTNSDYLEGTYLLHGIEEIMRASDALILIEPFAEDIAKIQLTLEQNVGLKIIAISSTDTPFQTIKIPRLHGFDSYFQLLAGWNLLTSIGLANNINLDETKRARKQGNAV